MVTCPAPRANDFGLHPGRRLSSGRQSGEGELGGWIQVGATPARRQALDLFPAFGLAGNERRRPGELSGGMRQRAALLRTFLAGREVILLDEPLGALDSLTRAGMQQWLVQVWEEHRKTILLITHDVDEALFLSDRVYVLSPRPGRVVLSLDVDIWKRGAPMTVRARPGLAGRVLPPLVFGLLVLGAWQAYTELADISPLLLPSPWEVAQVVWFGFTIVPKVIVVALVCFFPIVVNTIDGLKAVDPEMVRLLRPLGMSRPRIMRSVRVPSALPYRFSGLKVAMALSVIGALFGEWVGASEGLGYLMLALNNQLATVDLFAAVLVLSIMGIVLFFLVGLVERLVIPWHHESRRALQQQQ